MGTEEDFTRDVDGKDFESEESREPCRDFLKNICNRGARCKFYHPPDIAAQHTQKEEVNFCLDYQNKRCLRENCRYVHALREDAEAYHKSGNITESLARAIAAVTNKDTINGTPFCKEWLSGTCSRGQNRCRYWHVDPNEEKARRLAEIRGLPPDRQASSRDPPPRPEYVQYPMSREYERYERPYGAKRGRYDDYPPPAYARPPTPPRGYVLELERKNAELMRENESLHSELKRLKEQYEDIWHILYARRAVVVSEPSVMSAAAVPSVPATVPSTLPAAPAPAPPPAQTAPATVTLVSAADAHHLVASLAQQVQAAAAGPLPSIAMSRPSDAAVHWTSAMSMLH